MYALVVYESMFGNTRAIADAVAEGLVAGGGRVDVTSVDAAPIALPADLDLLVVGGPTHAFGMSRGTTRVDAVDKGAKAATSTARGIREWLDQIVAAPGLLCAAFDTRAEKVRRLPGSAARQASRRLRHRGYGVASRPASFYVSGVEGPLLDGELARARGWGETLATTAERSGTSR